MVTGEIKTRKAQTNKATYMRDEAFANLKQALEDALAFESGERRDLNVTRLQAHPKASSKVTIRQKLRQSQS